MPAPKTPTVTAKRFLKKTPEANAGKSAPELIDARIQELGDWRCPLLSRLRGVILSANSSVIEEWKWNVPVWSSDGIICTGETYKKAVKLTFAKGASLPDPTGLFNSSLDGNVRRAIDFSEANGVNEEALRALVRAAVSLNAGNAPRPLKCAAEL
jgi:hypothetical protein